MQKTWEQEKTQGWKCQNNECKETFRNKKELEKHRTYHQHHPKENITKTNITSQGTIKLDRRKPPQEGTPKENKFIYNNIKYSTEQSRWICQKCNKNTD